MRILYVILTCAKHLNTRVKWQKETWLMDVNEMDYVYLDKPVGEETYLNVPKKYEEFLKRMIFEDDYDWFFFCDDDTFVFTERLNYFLSIYSPIVPVVIGFKLGEFIIEGTDIKTECCSGGAGIAIGKNVVKNMQKYLRTEKVIITPESDTSLAVWYKLSTHNVFVMDRKDLFRPCNPGNKENEGLTNCITYHYCDYNDFMTLNKQI